MKPACSPTSKSHDKARVLAREVHRADDPCLSLEQAANQWQIRRYGHAYRASALRYSLVEADDDVLDRCVSGFEVLSGA